MIPPGINRSFRNRIITSTKVHLSQIKVMFGLRFIKQMYFTLYTYFRILHHEKTYIIIISHVAEILSASNSIVAISTITMPLVMSPGISGGNNVGTVISCDNIILQVMISLLTD